VSCCVYVVGSENGPWKVGISDCPKSRLQSLQTGSPIKLELKAIFTLASSAEAHIVERAIHAELAEGRIHGEWFNLPFSDVMSAASTAASFLGGRALDVSTFLFRRRPGRKTEGTPERLTRWRSKNKPKLAAYQRMWRARRKQTQ
jgi:hypothetical protein